ncbi:hypothetical protein [Desulfonatronum thiosulfatophilum]|uniref:hypothetical protein n=1 Tax=Desulfonatronum thiosulfatophilum TaxID=617002 RepID=UPI000B80C9C1|nr:hypothetical protein [Desulfonatronum thiosulfatophilum]
MKNEIQVDQGNDFLTQEESCRIKGRVAAGADHFRSLREDNKQSFELLFNRHRSSLSKEDIHDKKPEEQACIRFANHIFMYRTALALPTEHDFLKGAQ